MRPTQSDVHVNRPLSNILVAFIQSADAYIARKVFPVVPVLRKTDSYYKWDREDFFRVEAAERAPGTLAEVGGMTIATDSYNCKEYAIAANVIDAIRDNADNELDLDAAATRYVGSQLLLKREKVWTTAYFKTGVWTGTTAGGDITGVPGAPGANQIKQWDQATSTPIEDLRIAIVNMQEKTTYRPNTLVLGPRVWAKLQDHAEFLERIKYTQKGVVSTDLLAGLLGIDKVVVGQAVENTAKQGATGVYAFFQGKAALLLYAAPAPALMAPSAGYIFAWTGRFGAGGEGERVKRYRKEDIESDVIEGQMSFDTKVVASDLGCYFDQAVG